MAWIRTVEKSFDRLRETYRMEEAFQGWNEDRPALAGFGSLEELIRFCRNQNEDLLYEKNRVIAALCTEAAEGDGEAGLLLVWLFMGIFHNLAMRIGPCPLSPDELESEMLSAFWEEVRRAKEEKLSGTLFYAVKHRVWGAVREKRAEFSRQAIFNLEPAGPSPFVENPSLVVERAAKEGVLSEIDAELVIATRLEDLAVEEFGRKHGMSREQTHKRRQRAEQKLIGWLRAECALEP